MSGIPDELLPDDAVVLEDAPVCPGCGLEIGPAERQHNTVGYRGDSWHIGCAAAEDDGFERATPRYCPNCRGFSEWRPVDNDDETARLCDGCGGCFSGTETKRAKIGPDRSDQEGDE